MTKFADTAEGPRVTIPALRTMTEVRTFDSQGEQVSMSTKHASTSADNRSSLFLRIIASLAVIASASFAISDASASALDGLDSQTSPPISLPAYSGSQPLSRYLISIDPTLTDVQSLEASLLNAGASVVESFDDFNKIGRAHV